MDNNGKEKIVMYPMKYETSLLDRLREVMMKHGYRQLAPFIRMILYKWLEDNKN